MSQTDVSHVVELYGRPFVVSRSGRRIATSSLSSPNNILVLLSLMEELRPRRTLEVGLALGGSALALAGKHREFGAAPQGQHVAIDPIQDEEWDDFGVLAIQAAGLSGYFKMVRDFSSQALPRLIRNAEEFDLIYIDGSHLFEDVIVDFHYCARLVSLGGLVLFDDAADRHVAKVVRFVRRNMRHAFREVNLERHRGMTTLAECLKYRAARLLGGLQLACFERVGDPVRAWNSPLAPF